MRTIFKNAFFLFFFVMGGLSLFRWLNRNRLLILLYHGVLPSSDGGDEYLNYNFIDAKTFQWQMNYLNRHYTILPLTEIVNRIERDFSLPPYSAAVTFDDGFRNNFTVAFPILKEFRIPASIFIATGFIGSENKMLWTERMAYCLKRTKKKMLSIELGKEKISLNLSSEKEREQAANRILGFLKGISKQQREEILKRFFALSGFDVFRTASDDARFRFLNWTEVKTLAKNGIEIGSHTVNHEILSGLSTKEVWHEIIESKQVIEQNVENPCVLFSYPNGGKNDFSERDKVALKQNGYRCAVSLIKDLNPIRPDLMALRRVNIGRRHNRLLFVATVSGFIPFMRNSLTLFKS